MWLAEQEEREIEKKAIEHQKKLKEEKQDEELKRLQVQSGLLPESELQKLTWMYQGPS